MRDNENHHTALAHECALHRRNIDHEIFLKGERDARFLRDPASASHQHLRLRRDLTMDLARH